MDTGCAFVKKFLTLKRGMTDADAGDSVQIPFCRFEFLRQRRRQCRPAECGEALDLGIIGHRHDAGENGHANADRARFGDEIKIVTVLEKELGGHKRRACIHFAF